MCVCLSVCVCDVWHVGNSPRGECTVGDHSTGWPGVMEKQIN